MARYLLTTLPSNDLGLLTRSLPIARELANRGHSIVFCSPASAPRTLIADAGFENVTPIHPLYELIDVGTNLRDWARFLGARRWRHHGSLFAFLGELLSALPWRSAPRTTEVWNMDHAGATMGMLNEGFIRANCRAFAAVIERSRADVLIDFWNPFAVIAARALGMPVVTVIQADAHPRSGGFLWWKPLPPDLPSPVPAVNAVLGAYGLPHITKLADLSIGDLTLVVGMPEIDPLPEPERITYVGPLLWQANEAKLPSWIDDLPRGQPLIWVYSGNPRYASSGGLLDSAVVLAACVEALRDAHVQVVLSTGHHALPRELLPLPGHIRHEPYVPGLLMANRSDLLIHHGGYGSCQTGLYAGKPAVIIPTYSERYSNARRLSDVGAARIVPVEYVGRRKHVCAKSLRAAVEEVLGDPSFGDNARRLGGRLRSYGGATRAVELIEAFTAKAIAPATFTKNRVEN
jgi:UDP:flavonoid glycosyltransferase YjiC (YdhE family)